MARRNSSAAKKAWNILRLATLWARKGGMFKARFMSELPKYLKKLGTDAPPAQIHYGERQFSFDESPLFQVKMYRPASVRFAFPWIPCMNPEVDFDYDFGRNSFVKGRVQHEQEENGCEDVVSYEEEGIDKRAEEFIAKFYKQMKLQRQISYLQYEEMLNKGSN